MNGKYNVYLSGRRVLPDGFFANQTRQTFEPSAKTVSEAVGLIKKAKAYYRRGLTAWHENDYIKCDITDIGTFTIRPPYFLIPPEIHAQKAMMKKLPKFANEVEMRRNGFVTIKKAKELCRNQRYECKVSTEAMKHFASEKFLVRTTNEGIEIVWMGGLHMSARELIGNQFSFFSDLDVKSGRYKIATIGDDYIMLKSWA